MKQIITVSGAKYDLSKPAHCSAIKKVTGNGTTRMQELKILGLGGMHKEFMEDFSDLIVEDEFGDNHVVSESFIWQ